MKRPELQIVNGEHAGRRIAVGAGGLRLGRSSANDLCIRDEELSRNHCLIDPIGEDGISVTDLASANGTFVNGASVGNRARVLQPGDVLRIGGTEIRIVAADEPEAAAFASDGGVDLGLGASSDASSADAAEAGKSAASAPSARKPLANVLWAVAGAVVLGAAGVILFGDGGAPEAAPRRSVAPDSAAPVTALAAAETADGVREMAYEKVAGDCRSVFRYAMTLDGEGLLKVTIDDTSDDGRRHVVKGQKLKPAALKRLKEILSDPAFTALDRDYSGPETEPPTLSSWRLKVVYAARVKSVTVVNAPEPDEFRRVREKLEAFTKNELGVWAIQYSREKLVELATASAEAGRVKWEDRDVEHGNVYASLRAYREAVFYLDTVNPKPPEFEGYREALSRAEKELERRYREQRFCADRAINLGDWEKAREELQVLCEIVPDREDDRYREASAKLVDVETRLSRKGGVK